MNLHLICDTPYPRERGFCNGRSIVYQSQNISKPWFGIVIPTDSSFFAIQEASFTTRKNTKKYWAGRGSDTFFLVLRIGRWCVYHCGNRLVTTFLEWNYPAQKDKKVASKWSKSSKIKEMMRKARRRRAKNRLFWGIFQIFCIYPPPLLMTNLKQGGE